MSLITRPITGDEVATFRGLLARGFGFEIPEEDQEPDRFLAVTPLDRTVGAFDGNQMIGTLAAFPFDITVPGGAAVAMAGTTMVTVQPTHRRQGALTAMMREHLDDARARAEPLAGLWASESVIYGRFGFGSATENDQVEMHGPRIDLREEGGNLRFVAAEESLDVLAGVYDSVWRHRPGMLSRTQAWWKNEILFDPTRWRDGASPLHAVLHESYGIPDGYALFRQKPEWGEAFPIGQVRVKELIAASDDAHTGLWRFLASVDLFPEIRYSNAPVDDPLRWKVADPRRVTRKRWDALWLRVLDVPTALAARSYAADGSVRFRLADRFRPDNDGVYELEVVEGSGVCERVRGAKPDLSFDIDVLGGLYLGGGDAVSIARGGRIEGKDEAVVRLQRMFRGDSQPWCEEIF
jgi:predicted acetyltransferase